MFLVKEGARIRLQHPWRLFEHNNFQDRPWGEHLARYIEDRSVWIEILGRPDLDQRRGGNLNGRSTTILALTDKLIGHERHHLSALKRLGRGQTGGAL